MIDMQEVKNRVKGHNLVVGVDSLPRGHVRLETPFLYPDGSSVDVFLVEDENEPLLPSRKLSDLGQTHSWLLDVQVRPWLSKKRQRFVEDALRLHGVEQQGGALERRLDSLDDLMDGIVHLGQACVRVADLIYTRRSSMQVSMTEEVEEFLSDAEVSYDANQELEGRHGNRVRVDFLVRGPRLSSAILTLSTGNASQSHVAANEIFSKWYDLDVPARTEQRITIFDDQFDVYRDRDLRRLRDLSNVVALSDRSTLRDLLAA